MHEVMEATEAMIEKERRLKELIAGYGRIAIAYSGGVDSTYLSDVAHEVLGENAHLLLADTPSLPRSEFADARSLAKRRGWRLAVITTDEFQNEAFLKNDGRRCYYCKAGLFEKMREYTHIHGIQVLAYGENADDVRDVTRVGAQAAMEQGAVAPLQMTGLTKADIRALSARRQLPTWDKASFACLSSRFPIGTRLNLSAMARVEQAEEVLKRAGFRQYRARHHGDLCRIEIDPAEIPKMLEPTVRERVAREIAAAGYRYIAVDLLGYRSKTLVAEPPIAE